MINIFKNNLQRLKNRKYYMIITLVMFTCAIFAAIFITSHFKQRPIVAVVSSDASLSTASDLFSFKEVKDIPPKSDLLLNKYDAYVIPDGKGGYTVETIKNDDFKRKVLAEVTNDRSYQPPDEDTRQIGTNILGYLQMFLLLQLLLFVFPFNEDKERGQIARVAAAPISFFSYLAAHALFAFALISISTLTVLFVAKTILGINIGFSLLQYALFLTVICSFGTAFGLLVGSFAPNADNASMLGSPIILLTTMLSGTFYSLDKGSSLLSTLLYILPQKHFITFVHSIEKGDSISSLVPHLIYILALTIMMFAVAVYKTHKDYIGRIN